MNKEEVEDDRTLWEKMMERDIPESYTQYFKDEESFLLENVKENASVLDVGCGVGRSMGLIIPKTKNIIGLDHEEDFVKKGIRKFSTIDKGVKFVQGSASEMPFEKNKFDVVMCLLTFVNFGDFRMKAISEMKRVMKDDGVMLITAYSDDAFEDRKYLYDKVKVPVKKISGTTFEFEGNCEKSEQFSVNQMKNFFKDLNIIKIWKNGLAVFCIIKK